MPSHSKTIIFMAALLCERELIEPNRYLVGRPGHWYVALAKSTE
jgi:hypothetical protein